MNTFHSLQGQALHKHQMRAAPPVRDSSSRRSVEKGPKCSSTQGPPAPARGVGAPWWSAPGQSW